MNTLKRISNLLSQRIDEHKFEMAGCEVEMKKIQKSMSNGNTPKSIEDAYKLGVLKDKLLFHKSIMMAFQDFQKEIENENFLQSE